MTDTMEVLLPLCYGVHKLRHELPTHPLHVILGGWVVSSDGILKPRKYVLHGSHLTFFHKPAQRISEFHIDPGIPHPGDGDVDFGVVDFLEFGFEGGHEWSEGYLEVFEVFFAAFFLLAQNCFIRLA